MKKAIGDPFIDSKLHFFTYVSGLVEPFLTLFQADKPMIPFLYLPLTNLVLKLLEIIVKPNVLENFSTGCKLKIIDFKNDKNFLPLDQINAGFAVPEAVEKLKRKDIVSTTQIKNFMKDIRKFVIAKLEKICEKSILGSSFVRAATMFNSNLLLELSKQKLIDCLKVLFKHFMTLNICSGTQCDQVLPDLSTFYQNELKHARLNGSKFEKDKDRLDDFYVKESCFTVQNYPNYETWTSSRGERI